MIKVVPEDKVDTLSGYDGKNRDAMFEWWKGNPGSCLISSIIKEGVSINEIRACVVADYIADWEYLNQIIGRTIRRKEEDNSSHVTFFMETQHRNMLKSSRNVYSRLRSIQGYNFYHPVIHPGDISSATSVYTDSIDD